MAYTPINTTAFTAAYSGAIGGMAVSGWITDPNQADYATVTIIAGAFAQAFDQAWNNISPLNSLQSAAITSVILNEFTGRGPSTNANQLQQPSNWTVAARACVALVLECGIYFASQGITPGFPGSDVITDHHIITRNGTALVQHEVCYQLIDFGNAISSPLSAPFPDPNINTPATWSTNNTVLKAAFASGKLVQIPAGRYYFSETLTVANNTRIESIGGRAEFIYGPGWSGLFLEGPLVDINGVTNVQFYNVLFHGVYHTRRVIHIHALANALLFEQCEIASSAPTNFAVDCGYFVNLELLRCRITAGAFGFRAYNENGGLSQFLQLTNCYVSGNYIGVSLDSVMIVQFLELTNDADPGAEWISTGPVPSLGIYSPNDARGILNIGGYADIIDTHQENSQNGKHYGTGIETIVPSALRLSGWSTPGWNSQIKGPFAETLHKTGVLTAIQIDQISQRGTECWFLGSPNNRCTWDADEMCANTTANIESIAKFSIGPDGSAPKQLKQIAISLGTANVDAAVLEIVNVDNRTGTRTTAASFSLAAGNNTFSTNTYNLFSNFWDGWCGDQFIEGSGYALYKSWYLQIRITHSSIVKVRLPRVSFNSAVDRPVPTMEALGPIIWIPGYPIYPHAEYANTIVNVGSTAQSIANGATVSRNGVPTANESNGELSCGGGNNYYSTFVSPIQPSTFAVRAKILGANSSPFAVYGDIAPGIGYGFFVGKIGGTWQIYSAAGFTNTGVVADDDWHDWILTYDDVSHIITAYLDGIMIGTRNAVVTASGTPKLLLGCFDGGANAQLSIFKNPALLSGVASLNERNYIIACLNT